MISRHIAFEPDKVQIKVDRGKSVSMLALDIEIPNGHRVRGYDTPVSSPDGQVRPRCSWVRTRARSGLMRTIAFLTQKGGTGKTTLTASLAVAAADAGETVIAFDLDPQASLVRWGERRAASAAKKILIEPLERDRLSRLDAILQGVSGAGFQPCPVRHGGGRRRVHPPGDGGCRPLPVAGPPDAVGCGSHGGDVSRRLSGQAQSRVRSEPMPADLS